MISDEDVLKPSIRIALGAAIMAAAVALGLAALVSPDESMRYFVTVTAWVFTTTLGIALGWPIGIHIGVAAEAGRLARARMGEDIARHEKAAAEFRHEQALIGRGIPAMPADAPTPQIVNNEPRYSTEWNLYWTAALVYADSVGGVSFRRMSLFFGGDLDTWRECLAYPFVRAGMFEPVKERKETTPAGDWTIEKLRWAIERGVGPSPLPFAPPSLSQQNTSENSKKQAQNTVFAAEQEQQV